MSKTTLDEIMEDPAAVVKAATEESEFKLLNKEERKDTIALREMLSDLTSFQIRFIEQYIRCGVAGQAARLAGSKAANTDTVGYRLLQDIKIQRCIAIAMKKRIEAVGLDTVEVIQKIREVYDAAMEAGKFDAANKACELLQKEIERATKGSSLEATKVGKVVAGLGGQGHNDQEVVATELDRVVSLISTK